MLKQNTARSCALLIEQNRFGKSVIMIAMKIFRIKLGGSNE